MPRDPKPAAMKRLAIASYNYEAAIKAASSLGAQRRAAIVAAVEAGNTKASVARAVGVTPARVSGIVSEAS
jgi:hypothetical protein